MTLTEAIAKVQNFRDRYKEWAEKDNTDENVQAINVVLEHVVDLKEEIKGMKADLDDDRENLDGKPDPRTLDGHCGGCGAEIVKGVMKCDCEIPLCPSAGTWGMSQTTPYHPTMKLEQVIDIALEAPIPDGDITTAEEIAKAVRVYLKNKIEMCLRYNSSDTHIIAKDLLGEI